MNTLLIQRYLKAAEKNSHDPVTFADLIALTNDDSASNKRVMEAIAAVIDAEPVEVA